MTGRGIDRRRFLKLGGAAGAIGLSGCTMVAGSQAPSMGFMQQTDALQMFKGAPAHGNYPASPMEMTMEGMTMNAVPIRMVAKPDDSNNYHFMPHVAWVEPGTQVAWMHADIEGVSEPRAHSVTSFGAANLFPRYIPQGAAHFDSGFIAGLHGRKSVSEGIDHRFNQRMSRHLLRAGNPLGRGPFTHTFDREGVYLYYCQNHHMFKMAAAVVVGELWGENGAKAVDDPTGWSPAMTRNTAPIERIDDLHGTALRNQVHELREMIHSGGEMMGHHG
ncbi:MAG: hypothetical protein ABEJ92_08410 [Halobacteriales archaeon]